MPTTITLNGLNVVALTLWHPWQGAWTAEVDFDLAAVPVVPSGPCTITIGTQVLVGTIDEDSTGKFGLKGQARVVGGGGGWQRPVRAQHFHNDAGLLSIAVLAATAAELGEVVLDATPTLLGVDYMRTAGPGSRVLAGRSWYVDAAGVTVVGSRVTLPDPRVEVMSWDPQERRAQLASDTLIMPGTVLVDERLGTATVRDVEQRWSSGSSSATAYCSDNAKSRIPAMLGAIAKEYTKAPGLRTHHYRVVLQGPDGRVTLQAVSPKAGIPDSVQIPVWYGVPGVEAEILPGCEVAVQFLDGDPSKPIVTSFDGSFLKLKLGGPVTTGVATQASQAALMLLVATLGTTLAAFANDAAVKAVAPLTWQALATAAAALAAGAALPANYSQTVEAGP